MTNKLDWTQIVIVLALLGAGVAITVFAKIPSLGELLIGAAVGAVKGAWSK